MPWRRRRCPRRRRPRTGSSAATGCCRARTFTRRPWAPCAACRRRPRAVSCPEDPRGHGFIRSLRSWNAERYEEQHDTATGSIRATARQQQSKKHGEHAPLGMKRIRPAGKSRSTPTGTVRGTITCKTNFMSRGRAMSKPASTTQKRSITQSRTGKRRSTPTRTMRSTMACKRSFRTRGSSTSRQASTESRRIITERGIISLTNHNCQQKMMNISTHTKHHGSPQEHQHRSKHDGRCN